MKLIVLLILINIVFGGNCPPKEVFSPCDCEQVNYQIKYTLIDSLNLNMFYILHFQETQIITCKANTSNQISQAFSSVSKNLKENQKHFRELNVMAIEDPLTLEDDSFSEITFEQFNGENIKKISLNAFNKTAKNLRVFDCADCVIENDSKYDIEKVLNQLTELSGITIGLNIKELPTIAPAGGKTKLNYMTVLSHQKLTIKSGTFQHLNQLFVIDFWGTTIERIESGAFTFNPKTRLNLKFSNCTISGQSFQSGAFDGIPKPIEIYFDSTDIDYLPEEAFHSVFSKQNNNAIRFYTSTKQTGIDCTDCRNKWMVISKTVKNDQITANCRHDHNKYLFEPDIIDQLKAKCNQTIV